MGSTSVIATPTADGWQGRYCHSDGEPQHQVRELRRIVAAHGLDTARQILTEQHYGWSHLSANDDLYTGYAHDARFALAAGVGVAYTTAENQTSADEWYTNEHPQGIGWAYVLADTGITILRAAADGRSWDMVREVSWTETGFEDDLARIECGANFETCNHLASFHFPDAPDNLGTGHYLGQHPLGFSQAVAVLIDGERLPLTGSGSRGSATDPRDFRARDAYWWAYIGGRDIRIARLHPTSVPGPNGKRVASPPYEALYPLVHPATQVTPEAIVPAGTRLY